MDHGELSKEALDVRKVIEKSTSKVSLRDLEKKGFRQVKVLRAGDINQLITKALKNILAKQPRGAGLSEEERDAIEKEARSELDRQMAVQRTLQREKQEIEQKGQQIEEAKQRLEVKVAELNRQILAEKKAFQDEKRQFEAQKQQLYEKGLQGQQDAARNYEGQIEDLRARLARAESELQGAVSSSDYEAMRRRVEAADEDMQSVKRKARAQIAEMEEEVERYRAENRKLREEGAQSGTGGVDHAEMQRMRFEIEQRDASMREMIGGIAKSLAAAPAGGGGGDFSKQFKSLQQSLSDQLRKGLNSVKGGGEWDDLTEAAVAQMIANQTEDVVMETNARDIDVKETKAGSVKDKLARLRNLKKG
ncbi:MAG: hypothetical protein KDD82_22460 [Planctomycetes bacterium]|nr:hypothetical protein [Planctomycetota bacterium]